MALEVLACADKDEMGLGILLEAKIIYEFNCWPM